MITLVVCALAALGAGRVSLDHLIGLDRIGGTGTDGWLGLLIAVLAGGGGAALTLATSWRPARA